MKRLWICGICQNNADELREILAPLYNLLAHRQKKEYALGTIWVDGHSLDDSRSIIEQHCGYYLQRYWTNDHDFQMNVYLRERLINHGDWVLQLDTSERISPEFIERLQDVMLNNFEEQGINTVYQRSKPLMYKWHDDMIYSGSPHWGIQNQRPHAVDISKFDGFDDDKTYVWSLRDDINKWILNGIKYYLVYGRSNHMWLIYNPANYPGSIRNLIQEHEAMRLKFRDYCRNTLGISLDCVPTKIMREFDTFLKTERYHQEFIDFMNYEKIIANYYRYIVKKEDQKVIYDTQNEWKF